MDDPSLCVFPEDWASAWRQREKTRRPPDDVQVWNSRAAEYGGTGENQSSYVKDFLSLLAPILREGDRILDMGAGNGSLSLPLLASGYRVLAADFSPAMLAELSRRYYGCTAALDGPLDCVQVDFNAPFDTWEALAITRGSVDVAIASRSTMVADLAAAFGQLELSAKRSVAVTMATEYGPRSTKRLGQDDGSGVPFIPDYVYALNILLQHGRYPSLSWIDSWKPTAEANCLRLVRWAFISWDVPIPLFSSHASGNVGVA